MSQSLLGGLLTGTINPLTGLPTAIVEYLVVAGPTLTSSADS